MRISRSASGVGFVGLAFGLSACRKLRRHAHARQATAAVPLTGRTALRRRSAGIGRCDTTGGCARMRRPRSIRGLPPRSRPSGPADTGVARGRHAKAVNELEYAAEKGVPVGAVEARPHVCRWRRRARRIAMRAFEYFSRHDDSHADDEPGHAQARFVANAFVALGRYYLDGIPNSAVKADPTARARCLAMRRLISRDPDAQYNLGRLYLDGRRRAPIRVRRRTGSGFGQERVSTRRRRCSAPCCSPATGSAAAARWAVLAHTCQGRCRSGRGLDHRDYSSALPQATDDERGLACKLLENWLGRGLE